MDVAQVAMACKRMHSITCSESFSWHISSNNAADLPYAIDCSTLLGTIKLASATLVDAGGPSSILNVSVSTEDATDPQGHTIPAGQAILFETEGNTALAEGTMLFEMTTEGGSLIALRATYQVLD